MANIYGNKERATEIILNHELLLMEQLSFHITVHNPWRPVEGLMIDIKTRLLPVLPVRIDLDKFRPEIERFLDEAVAYTSATLIYAPSQVLSYLKKSILGLLHPVLLAEARCHHGQSDTAECTNR